MTAGVTPLLFRHRRRRNDLRRTDVPNHQGGDADAVEKDKAAASPELEGVKKLPETSRRASEGVAR